MYHVIVYLTADDGLKEVAVAQLRHGWFEHGLDTREA